MDNDSNDDGLINSRRVHNQLLNWIFLPLPLAILVIGLGILTGLVFRESPLLQGHLKWIIGLALVLYGGIRSTMILNKIRRKGVAGG